MIDRTDTQATGGWLSSESWNAIQRSVPICGVDFFPVELDPATNEVLRVGLISRPFPTPIGPPTCGVMSVDGSDSARHCAPA
ncbi:hypothetical protein LH935_05880 [Gordonia polyisoprenivorans]|uniref:hypothetical protein n=1 Tax=Gordonia polyisoprenivorans TaxID=84595 RepID=UPI002234CE2C|nr:hypothetical protein LH935_05880 [Gordonia polyisoprenivorans]